MGTVMYSNTRKQMNWKKNQEIALISNGLSSKGPEVELSFR